MPSRRTYLATLAAVGLAGCVDDAPGTGTESPTDTDSPTATTAPGTSSPPDVTVEAAAVQYSYRHIENVDWNAIQPANGQFVFVTIDARPAETAPNGDAFTLVADGETHPPVEMDHSLPPSPDVPGHPYITDRDDAEARGWLLFEISAQLDSAPSLRLDRDSGPWEWDLDTEKATSPPPEWEYTADAPETVAPDETFDITISAENVGGGPGVFRGAVNFSYPLYHPKGFDIALDPGASGEASVEASTEDADPGQEIDYGIRTPVGASTVTVIVEGDGTVTTTTDTN